MFFLSGVAKYLFVPLGGSRRLCDARLVYSVSNSGADACHVSAARQACRQQTRNPLVLFQRGFERAFERSRAQYQAVLTTLVYRRFVFIPVFLLACAAAMLLVPVLGQDFFPNADTGQFKLHVRANTGTRIEEIARLCDLIDAVHSPPDSAYMSWKQFSTISACPYSSDQSFLQQLRADRDVRRRHSGDP